MHRLTATCLVLILALLAAQPAVAGGSKQREVELMTQQFEQFFQPMIGAVEARDLVFTDHGNGFRSLSYGIDPARITARNARAADDKPFRTLACGHSVTDPSNPATLVTAVISDLETEYNLWWTLLNKRDEDVVRRTNVNVTGPGGFEIDASEDVLYGANAVHLVWFNPETPFAETGVYTHRVTVKTGGKAVYKFFAEVASTTTLER